MVREDREDPSLLAAAGPALGGMGGARFAADRRPLAGAGPRFVPAPEVRPRSTAQRVGAPCGLDHQSSASPPSQMPASPPHPSPDQQGCQVVVHGLPYKLAWQELKDLCRAYGAVTRADVATNPDGSSKGYGLVAFASPADAAAAIQVRGRCRGARRGMACGVARTCWGGPCADPRGGVQGRAGLHPPPPPPPPSPAGAQRGRARRQGADRQVRPICMILPESTTILNRGKDGFYTRGRWMLVKVRVAMPVPNATPSTLSLRSLEIFELFRAGW